MHFGELCAGLTDRAGPKTAGEARAANWDETVITGLTADSRAVRAGFLFAAMKGTLADGTAYIPQAIEQGAAAILLDHDSDPALRANLPDRIALCFSANPRRSLAQMAAKFTPHQPETIVAVTGTNGKTSVASFVRQIWQMENLRAASLGTVGVQGPNGILPLQHTTPEPVFLHQILDDLVCKDQVSHLALEASSHGLAQYRLDGLKIKAAGFTNISRDHLDYHADFEDYFAQKLRLFRELLPEHGVGIVDLDDEGAGKVLQALRERGCAIIGIAAKAGANQHEAGLDADHLIKLQEITRRGFTQELVIGFQGKRFEVNLPLVGDFQASNALMAAGLCIAGGMEAEKAFLALEKLQGARGRLDLVGARRFSDGGQQGEAPIFVDYAHTPDALANALRVLRPYVGGQLWAVFGCGGDRDRGKRAQMGAIAAQLADRVIVTDDNPRSEPPEQIRAEIMSGAKQAEPFARTIDEIAPREQAIAQAIGGLEQGDVLLVAGKGHETGQEIKGEKFPFCDHEEVLKALG